MSKYDNLSKEELLRLIEKQEEEIFESKKYGLNWDNERDLEQVVLDCKDNLPILERVSEKEIRTNKYDYNILIEGDNYHALTVLSYTHKDKIDVIYIDPPYNTGNATEWKYNDKFVDENDSYRHSKWLNMMEKRLNIAKSLLKNGGSIFISIGDDEVANLKLLCDKVLDKKNFITLISRIAKTASNKGKFFAPSCDYILLYTKFAEALSEETFAQEVDESLYKKEDEFGRYRDDVAFYQSSLDPLRGCSNQRYYVEAPDGSLLLPPGDNFPDKKEDACFIPPKTSKDKVWRWSYETYLSQKHLLVFKETKTSPLLDENGNQAKYNIYTKSYLHERQKTGVKPRNFLIEKEFLNRKGADYIKKMGINFNYSKPKALIQYLIELCNSDKNAIILDFFAGSGTTGEVVLDINKKDGGNRKFILCTNNEVGAKEENEFIKDNNINYEEYTSWLKQGNQRIQSFLEKNGVASSVCYPRIKNVILGYKEISKSGEEIKGLGGNLQYFKTNFVKKTQSRDQVRFNLTNKCTEMLCVKDNIFHLEKESKNYKIFSSNDKKRFLCVYYSFIKNEITDFMEDIKQLDGQKNVYMFSETKEVNLSLFKEIKNIHIEAIPEPILEIYKDLIKMNIGN